MIYGDFKAEVNTHLQTWYELGDRDVNKLIDEHEDRVKEGHIDGASPAEIGEEIAEEESLPEAPDDDELDGTGDDEDFDDDDAEEDDEFEDDMDEYDDEVEDEKEAEKDDIPTEEKRD